MSKTCNRCGIDKDLNRFSKNNKSKDGYKIYCKECISKETKAWRISIGGTNRIDRSRETPELKICTKCNLLHKRSDFNHVSWCRFCINRQNRKYADAHGVKEKFIPIVTDISKQCCMCKNIKLLLEFSPSKRGRLGKSSYCKPCASQRVLSRITKEESRQKTQRY